MQVKDQDISKMLATMPPKRRANRRLLIIPVILLALLIGAGVGGYLLYLNYHFYSTDDAVVTGNIVNILPKVTGTLSRLDVQVGDTVMTGQSIGTIAGNAPGRVTERLIAPMDGIIVQIPCSVGQVVSTATTIAQETDPRTIKITAYVDENAINSIAIGQAADVHIDAYNRNVTGHVTKIVGATAGQFALLPTTDNSSGNYTKVSQRIPVYILPDIPDDGSLSPGMSVEVTIHLHD